MVEKTSPFIPLPIENPLLLEPVINKPTDEIGERVDSKELLENIEHVNFVELIE